MTGGPTGGGGGGVVLWKGWYALTGLGQENLLGFLLFWIGSYALIHGKSCPDSLMPNMRANITQCMTRCYDAYDAWVIEYCLLLFSSIAYLELPVLGSIGPNGQRAAPIVRPSSLSRLYVEAALRYHYQRTCHKSHEEAKVTHRVHHVELYAQTAHVVFDLLRCRQDRSSSPKQQDLCHCQSTAEVQPHDVHDSPGLGTTVSNT